MGYSWPSLGLGMAMAKPGQPFPTVVDQQPTDPKPPLLSTVDGRKEFAHE